MREIKFRAKRVDNGAWVYGHYMYSEVEEIHYIATSSFEHGFKEVDPTTVCQFTGLCDKNGKCIYEGDVVDGYSGKYQLIFVQVTGTGYFFYWKPLEQCTESMTGFIDEYTVIGNIYDNKDLLSN